ncbi:MAG: phosphomannomutase/phosphoglucomutase [Acidimicrobiia bacterium]|nr:phosphomannomutase/phosphoglucomutase [Acidimicrobiia bacterium]
MLDTTAVFKAYDIRGTVPDQLDSDLCRAIGAAFAAFVRRAEPETGEVIIGRDMRPSGVELSAAFVEGVQSQGLSVVTIGLASTDLVYFASGHLDLPGVIFTASHNPAGYNGIKACLSSARPIGVDTGLADIEAMVHDPPAPADTLGGARSLDLLDEFVQHVRTFVDITALAPLKVVADTANGMGGLVVPAAFHGLPIDLEVMYAELDGTFPNHPADPIQPENQRDLQERVLEVGADVGLAFDGDADRVFVVDERAEPLSGSTITAMVADRMLRDAPGATIIHNLICSKTVGEVVTEAGGTALRSRVGHSYIKAMMAESGALFAGEHSGHYYFRDNFRADSGLIAAMVVLELVSTSGQALSELRIPYERYWASGERNSRVDDAAAVIERVAATFDSGDVDRLDGLTVTFDDWWFNLRPSNTEPLLRLNLEAADEASGRSRVAEVEALMVERT